MPNTAWATGWRAWALSGSVMRPPWSGGGCPSQTGRPACMPWRTRRSVESRDGRGPDGCDRGRGRGETIDALVTPSLLLDRRRLDRNIQRLADHAERLGVVL